MLGRTHFCVQIVKIAAILKLVLYLVYSMTAAENKTGEQILEKSQLFRKYI